MALELFCRGNLFPCVPAHYRNEPEPLFDNSSLVSFSALVILLLSAPLLILHISSMIRSVLAVPRFFEYREGIEHKFRHRGTSNNLSYRPSRRRPFPAVAIIPDGTRTRALLTNQLYSLSTMHPIMRFRPAYGLRTTTATNAERTLQKFPVFAAAGAD